MTKEERIRGYVGLAAKGGKVVSGEFSTEKAVKSGRASLVILAADASENTKKKFTNMCEFYELPCLEFGDREQLGQAVGKEFRASIAILDPKLAAAVLKLEE